MPPQHKGRDFVLTNLARARSLVWLARPRLEAGSACILCRRTQKRPRRSGGAKVARRAEPYSDCLLEYSRQSPLKYKTNGTSAMLAESIANAASQSEVM